MIQVWHKMVQKIIKLTLIWLLLMVQGNPIPIYASQGDEEISLQEKIHNQKSSHMTENDALFKKYPQLEDEHITNRCAFVCGRCQICHARCYNFDKVEIAELPLDCPVTCCQYTTYWITGIAIVASMLSGTLWNFVFCCKAPANSVPLCNLIQCSPTIAGAGLCTLCICHGVTGGIVYCCADCMGKEEFKADFRRGLYCTPVDCCYPTNLWLTWSDCWNPCCGKSEYKSR